GAAARRAPAFRGADPARGSRPRAVDRAGSHRVAPRDGAQSRARGPADHEPGGRAAADRARTARRHGAASLPARGGPGHPGPPRRAVAVRAARAARDALVAVRRARRGPATTAAPEASLRVLST